MSHTSVRIGMVGLTLFITKIPALKQGSGSRCGQFSNREQRFRSTVEPPPLAHTSGQVNSNGHFIALPSFPLAWKTKPACATILMTHAVVFV
jgi:hypothetical protein